MTHLRSSDYSAGTLVCVPEDPSDVAEAAPCEVDRFEWEEKVDDEAASLD